MQTWPICPRVRSHPCNNITSLLWPLKPTLHSIVCTTNRIRASSRQIGLRRKKDQKALSCKTASFYHRDYVIARIRRGRGRSKQTSCMTCVRAHFARTTKVPNCLLLTLLDPCTTRSDGITGTIRLLKNNRN